MTRTLRAHGALLTLLLVIAPVAALAQAPPPQDVAPPPPPAEAHEAHERHEGHEGHEGHQDGDEPLPPFIPVLTDEDRRAAFPDVHGHSVHDRAINYFVLVDRAEWRAGSGDRDVAVDATGWVGRDIDRLWLRAEGSISGTRLEHGEANVLYGRAVARWWDVVAGVRQDGGPGPNRTWAAIGIQGLAPYWFDVEATAYVGSAGRTHLRVDTDYDLLITNRIVLQPTLALNVYGKADPARDIGAGLSSTDLGLRVRYVVRRECAPYVGVTWARTYFGTADRARAAGTATSGTRIVVGVRAWL